MRDMKTIDATQRVAEETVVAVGVFDGVHLGHQELLKEAARVRHSLGLPVMAMTFHPTLARSRVVLTVTAAS
jgi:cytidyltransferase-like protein